MILEGSTSATPEFVQMTDDMALSNRRIIVAVLLGGTIMCKNSIGKMGPASSDIWSKYWTLFAIVSRKWDRITKAKTTTWTTPLPGLKEITYEDKNPPLYRRVLNKLYIFMYSILERDFIIHFAAY